MLPLVLTSSSSTKRPSAASERAMLASTLRSAARRHRHGARLERASSRASFDMATRNTMPEQDQGREQRPRRGAAARQSKRRSSPGVMASV
jgi:hypothetical protein